MNISEEHEAGTAPKKTHMDNVADYICDLFELAAKSDLNRVAVKISGLIEPDLFNKSNIA